MSIKIEEMNGEDINSLIEEYNNSAMIAGFDCIDSMEDFKVDASLGMIKFGGSFAHFLGHALAHADSCNASKIIRAFINECNHHACLYREWDEKRIKENNENKNDVHEI